MRIFKVVLLWLDMFRCCFVLKALLIHILIHLFCGTKARLGCFSGKKQLLCIHFTIQKEVLLNTGGCTLLYLFLLLK